MIDLIEIWNDGLLPKILNDNKNDKKVDSKENSQKAWEASQSSFYFDKSPQVVFVTDLHTQSKANQYGDLPKLPLQPEEKKIYKETRRELGRIDI